MFKDNSSLCFNDYFVTEQIHKHCFANECTYIKTLLYMYFESSLLMNIKQTLLVMVMQFYWHGWYVSCKLDNAFDKALFGLSLSFRLYIPHVRAQPHRFSSYHDPLPPPSCVVTYPSCICPYECIFLVSSLLHPNLTTLHSVKVCMINGF